ncbi:SusC/RagA family TonB-linked outer membrane protein [Chryseobacterium gallinarum]|uniref:SusC/RagA family TonB-linked outer membrane protein n=1 Tax=Chryseobacterium gallinarum TaxID=1324352 RepID=UPI0020248804|nr:SusC/RagA family TonB-linked outer membrane protein [Chryseobacterium gallinarum]MCL8537669.1 SusC/RagA family TonB-linked outer membrane protein [Chryseobacterium gallinarum]
MKNFLTFFLLVWGPIAIAQQHTVKGQVVDGATGSPLRGVMVTGQKANVITDADGKFLLPAEESMTILRVTYPGYQEQEFNVEIPQKEPLKISLSTKITRLQEVTITTGYQKLPKERATGSFSTVDQKLLGQQTTTHILDRLPAIANGITVDRGTSGTAQMMIRGLSTINGPKSPLIVLDNFPYEGDIANINPNIVESITVLKDAAAASIWGARAANGVIVITTKNSRFSQPLSLEFTANTSCSGKPDLGYLKPISSSDFIDVEQGLFKKGFYDNDINSPYHPVLSPVVDLLNKEKNGLLTDEEASREINRLRSIDSREQYRRYMYRPLENHQYSLNLSGGAPSFSWISSLGYDDNTGNLGEEYKRLNLRFQNTWQPIRQLSLVSGIYFTHVGTRSGRSGYGSIGMKGNSAVPYMQLANESGNALVVPSTYDQNYKDAVGGKGLLDWNYYPLTDWQHNISTTRNAEVMLTAALNYKIIKGLDLDIKYQYQRQSGNKEGLHDEGSYYTRNYINKFAQVGAGGTTTFIIPKGGILDKSNSLLVVNNLRGQLNYNRNWGNHRMTAIAGIETRDARTKSDYNRYYGYNPHNLSVGGIDYTHPYPNFVNGSSEYIQKGQSLEERDTRFVSLYANAAYTYQNKYTVSGSARRDASNLFGLTTNNQWNPFWSAGFAWDISREKFYNLNWLPYLKLRGSYGFNGNIDPAMVAVTTIAYYANGNVYTGTPMARFENYYNPNLKWESSRMINLGFDFSSHNNRVSGSIEYFTKKGTNLFGNAPIDYTTGITNMLMNVAGMKGSGLDIELKTTNIDRAFKWNTMLNFSVYHDKITRYYLSTSFASDFVNSGSTMRVSGIEGLPVYSVFAYPWAGLDSKTGDPLGYIDGQVSSDYSRLTGANVGINDLQYFGSAIPTTYGSFINSFSYKNFSLDIGLTYKFGYWFRRSSINYTDLFTSWMGHSDYEQRWQQPGDEQHTDVPSNPWETNSNRDAFYNGSSVLVEKGDHIRLQYINLSYSFSKDLWPQMLFQSFQIYCNMNNLGVIWRANKSGIDPDFNLGGSTLKPPMIFTLGLRAKF